MAQKSFANVNRPTMVNSAARFTLRVPPTAQDMALVSSLKIKPANANATQVLLGLIALRQTLPHVIAIAVGMETAPMASANAFQGWVAVPVNLQSISARMDALVDTAVRASVSASSTGLATHATSTNHPQHPNVQNSTSAAAPESATAHQTLPTAQSTSAPASPDSQGATAPKWTRTSPAAPTNATAMGAAFCLNTRTANAMTDG